jgi:nitrogen PTS system EIIA component
MDTILDALQEGRLFELPENDKTHALQFLSHVIEAFPEVPSGTDVVGLAMKREEMTNTALGKGWACPHARVPYDEDLMCVVGWSPAGIDYGAPDGLPVSLIVMYLVPANERNHYLREVSRLAKALENYPDVNKIKTVTNLDEVRNYLLDLIEVSKETVGPDARAKMIRLQSKPTADVLPITDLSKLIVEPVTVIGGPRIKTVILSQNDEIVTWLDGAKGLIESLAADGTYKNARWHLTRRSMTSYQQELTSFDCLAIRLADTPLLPAKPEKPALKAGA